MNVKIFCGQRDTLNQLKGRHLSYLHDIGVPSAISGQVQPASGSGDGGGNPPSGSGGGGGGDPTPSGSSSARSGLPWNDLSETVPDPTDSRVVFLGTAGLNAFYT